MSISLETIVIRLLTSLLLGALIGWEREYSEHNAGIRTVALVSAGTSLFTIISAFGFIELIKYPHITLDPTRIASYIVAGIGFLGGGTIFYQRELQRVRGLTTAATIWIVAAIGMACGAGLLLVAVIVTALTLLVLIGMRYIEAALTAGHGMHMHTIEMKLQSDVDGNTLGCIYDMLAQASIVVQKLEVHKDGGDDSNASIVRIECWWNEQKAPLNAISRIKDLSSVQEVKVSMRRMTPSLW